MNRLFLLLFGAMSLVAHAQVPNYVPTDGLVAWYPLDGNGSGSAFTSGDAIVTGAQPTTDRFGNPEGAMIFDGNGNLSIPSSSWNFVSPQFSFSIWYNVNTPGSISAYIVEKGSTIGGWEYALSFEPNGEARFIIHDANGSGGYLLFQGGQIGEGWNHVGFSFNMDGTSFLALNDDIVSQPTVPNGSAFQPGTSTLNLGARRGWANHPDPFGGLNGSLDDFAFWNRALTPSEMQAMYDVQTGCLDTSACNYNPLAAFDDGSCISCEVLSSACGEGTVWDSNTSSCIVANPTDTDLDGCTGVGDVLEVLSTFGQCYTTWACGDPMNYHSYDYATVLIGDQCWFAENLRATAFNDGTDIAYVSEANAWTSADSPARCWHDNTEDSWPNGGFLYNGYVITNERNVCPEDWSPAADEDWKSVESLHGMPEAELDQMDITRGADEFVSRAMSGTTWNQGTNDLGLNVIPGGYRIWNTGVFSGLPTAAFWAISGSEGFYREMNELWDGVNRSQRIFNQGFSVRCIKD